ncbi:hypothetical protein Hamer_G009340 [Homarus americanus]|uniref:Uncharacterized protein n=1 Tax=Homarus americanus TaxID=6706 RepID=A0A8J5JFS4_HOMAM|nr:hypothetical protein Hamer_G009340 [Homarus americanus]
MTKATSPPTPDDKRLHHHRHQMTKATSPPTPDDEGCHHRHHMTGLQSQLLSGPPVTAAQWDSSHSCSVGLQSQLLSGPHYSCSVGLVTAAQ